MNIKDLSLDQKIGQMIIAGFESFQIDEHFDDIVEKIILVISYYLLKIRMQGA